MSRSRSLIGIIAVLAAAMMLPAVTAAATPITFGADWDGIRIGDECVSGHAPSERALHLVWKDSDGSSKTNAYISTGYGYWSYCSDDGDTLAPGDVLKATVGSTTRQFVMPNLTITVDRVHDVFRGRGPAGATLDLYYIYNGCCAPHQQHENVTVDAEGRWLYDEDYPTEGSSADIIWTNAKGDNVYANSSAPDVLVFIGRAIVAGTTNAGTHWKVVLRDPTNGIRKGVAQGTTDEWGSFTGVFLDAAGHPVTVTPGDRVVGTSLAADMDFIVRDITATADVVTDVVTGKCGNKYFSDAEVRRNGRTIGWTAYFDSIDGDGNFQIDFSQEETLGYDPANIRHGDRLVVTCQTKHGDFVQKSILVP